MKWTTPAMDGAWRAAGQDLDAEIEALFRRCPALSGFSVQPKVSADGNTGREEELFVTAIGIEAGTDRAQYPEIFEQIATTLKDLLAERPETHVLMRGRTFARAFH